MPLAYGAGAISGGLNARFKTRQESVGSICSNLISYIVSLSVQGNVTSELLMLLGQLERIRKTDILWATISNRKTETERSTISNT